MSSRGLANALKFLKKYYSKKPLIVVSAPGRVDFLNTHQDYKGLPVIPIAINLRTYIMVLKYSNDFRIESINLREMGEEYIDIFDPHSFEIVSEKWFGNYFRAVVSALKKNFRIKELKGIHAVIYSDIPIGSGLASSAALEVAFTKTLDIIYDLRLGLKDIAEISYIAEHDECRIPCGRLDQYSSTYGDIIRLETKPPYNVQRINYREFKITVVDSGIRHSTGAIHPVRQQEIDSALRKLMTYGGLPHYLCDKLGYRYDEPKWED
ncbi:MAG TPA: GHMP kinase, partial [Thermoprotei archaeon]|nr:GHMP kinase [Thermoprotei archaeon]